MEGQKKPIVFRIGEETKPVIVGVNNYKESLLSNQIDYALRAVDMMLDECKNEKSWVDTPFSDVYHNNIISYLGERGSGKTSCMYSVANILRERENSGFYCLDAIDPSFFDLHHNILQIVIGKMYGKFNDSLKDQVNLRREDYEIMNLRKQFQQTKSHLRYLGKEPEYEDDNEMEELYQLASGVDLKDSLRQLVDKFLKYFNKNTLLITIDDIDQNTSQAYEMAEQIRKYLILPNVIIQMAAKQQQLQDVIKNILAGQYRNLWETENTVDVDDMSDRYMMKLLPLETRVLMPDMDVLFDAPLKIINGNEELSIDDVKTTVTSLIFRKCRYLFYNTRGTTSLIVPRNLRELRMLIGMLVKMPDYHTLDVKGNYIRSEENKALFRKYFFVDWVNQLSYSSQVIARDLVGENDPTKFNKKVISLLKRNNHVRLMPENLDSLVSDTAISYNVSLGDAFTFMDYLGKVDTSRDTRLLLFFIKSLYSIRLYEYYDARTDMLAWEEKGRNDSKPYRRDDMLENVSYLQKLVGGSYYNLSGESMIVRANRTEDPCREKRMIDGNELNVLIRDVVKRYNSVGTMSETDKRQFTDDLQMAEFFMLTTSRFVMSKSAGRESGDYKERTEAYYVRDLSKTTNIEFDVMAPFFTMLDFELCYRRFHEKVFEIAKEWNDKENGHISLYNRIIDECHDRTSYLPEHDMLSKITIRNAEIAEDLFSYLERGRTRYRPEDAGEIGILHDFYKKVFQYQIATYDWYNEENGKASYYLIRFIPFKVLSEFLSECKDQTKFYSIYNKQLALKVAPYLYLDKSMDRDTIWNTLIELYPSLDTAEHKKDFLYRFQKDKKYNKSVIILKLEGLSSHWGVKINGSAMGNE